MLYYTLRKRSIYFLSRLQFSKMRTFNFQKKIMSNTCVKSNETCILERKIMNFTVPHCVISLLSFAEFIKFISYQG